MNIEINDRALEARIQKQIQAPGAASAEEALLRLLETQEEQDRWLLENKATINARIRRGIEQLERGEGISENQLDAYLAKLKPSLDEASLRSRAGGRPRFGAIWRYIKNDASLDMADRVESVIIEKISYLAARPGAGHWRKDLTDERVKFFSIYAYLTGPRLPQCRLSPFSMAAAMWSRF